MFFQKSFALLILIFLFYTNSVSSKSFNDAIYFCTRDLGVGSSQAGIEEENTGNAYIKVIPNIENSKNTILRHCFMTRASKTIAKDDHDYLMVETTVGFFAHPNNANKAVRLQEHLTEQVISCTQVRAINDGEDEDIVWQAITDFYGLEVRKGYDAYSHNCCTVAYESISTVAGDTSAIDPRSFNFGVGTRWKFENSGSSYGLLKSVSIVSDQMFYVAESGSPSGQSFEDSKMKEEL